MTSSRKRSHGLLHFYGIDVKTHSQLDNDLRCWEQDVGPLSPISVPVTAACREVLRRDIMKALESRDVIGIEEGVADE